MSGLDGLITHEAEALPPAEPLGAGSKKPEESDDKKELWEVLDDDEEEEELENSKEEEEYEEEMTPSAHLEPNTLPWPEDKDKRPRTDNNDGVWPQKVVSEPKDGEAGLYGGGRDQEENAGKSKWRESMPEGDRWGDDEIEPQRDHEGNGSLADDEDEGEEEQDKQSNWISEKSALGFTPRVTIVRPSSKELLEESRLVIEKDEEREPRTELHSAAQFHPEWTEPDDKYYLCERLCGSKLRTALVTAAGALLFPLLLWGGYALLPFDPPLLRGTPLRVVYTLRCAFFAIVPILLGVVVQGAARLRYSALQPLYQSQLVHREVAVHRHYVNESLALFLFFFLQLAVMATYISQDLLKLVPLLTIIFVFGRLIYWLCLSLGSSFRALGFGLSFFPILVMLGTNLYFVCASVGQEAVFDVEPPTTAPPPSLRWWG